MAGHLQPIKLDSYKPLRELVCECIRQAIIDGTFSPGERLMEIQMADEMGVSRTPVREAIRKLELEGFVVMIPRRGTYVADISIRDITEIYEIRACLDELAAGLAAVVFGGDMVVDNASLIAKAWGMSDTLVGLTIVAVGTSLPELVTSITASKKGDSGIALGNAVGSCLFNTLFILGMASTLTPINAVPELIIDTAILIGVTILILIVAKTGRKTNRVEGIICVTAYVIYTAYIILR